MTRGVLNFRESVLRGALARTELVGLESRVASYCAAALAMLGSMAPDDPARRDLLARAIETLEWAHLMTRAARASRADQLREASRMASYLNTRLAETRCG